MTILAIARRGERVLFKFGEHAWILDTVAAQRVAQAINVVVADIDIPKEIKVPDSAEGCGE